MKKTLLSLFVIAACGAYVWDRFGREPSHDLLGSPVPSDNAQASGPPASAARQVTLVDIPVSRLRPPYLITQYLARTAITLAANTGFADGTYTGPAVDVYYGLVQIQAIVQGGQLVAIRVLQYPSDRSTSVYINRQALPMLRDEVISAQTANVDIISGATLTSEGFIFSLGAALKQASS